LKDDVTTVKDCLQEVAQRLEDAEVYLGHGTDNYWDEAVHLVLFAMGQSLDADVSLLEKVLEEKDQKEIEAILSKRIEQRLPLPYITGQAWFAGLCFTVSPDVLIPRSPLAELIEKQFFPWCQSAPTSVLDLCCGGGCIGIACAQYLPDAQVDLSDISPQALQVAQQNIDQHGLQSRVVALQSDLLNSVPAKQYDVIVSNPPYVDAEDMSSLPAEYLHEPAMALAAGEDGLDLVRTILKQAASFLSDDGVLIVEVGNSWEALETVYPEVPFIWLEFERGGHGVFLLSKRDLQEYQSHFQV